LQYILLTNQANYIEGGIGSPVYYAMANGTLVSFVQRLFYSTRFDKENEGEPKEAKVLDKIHIEKYCKAKETEKIISYSGEEGLDYITQELIDINYWEIASTYLAKAIDELDFKQVREEQEISDEYGR